MNVTEYVPSVVLAAAWLILVCWLIRRHRTERIREELGIYDHDTDALKIVDMADPQDPGTWLIDENGDVKGDHRSERNLHAVMRRRGMLLHGGNRPRRSGGDGSDDDK